MEIVSKDKFRSDIISFFEAESGMSIDAAIGKIKAVLIIDKWGNTHNDSLKVGNVRLFYTNNANYCGGVKSGYGKGWYISNQGFTGGNCVKLNVGLAAESGKGF